MLKCVVNICTVYSVVHVSMSLFPFERSRAEGFLFSHIADEGLLKACAGDFLRYSKQIGADHIQICTDIMKHRYDLICACALNHQSLKTTVRQCL